MSMSHPKIKIDLTEYSDNELSMVVFRNEDLYEMRTQPWFIAHLRNTYVFTDKQLAYLRLDLDAEESE